LLSVSFEGCAPTPQIVYKDVPPNTIVLDNKTYDVETWGVYRRETIKNILETVIEKDSQLRECLEREKIK
jgi:hypothetical protein